MKRFAIRLLSASTVLFAVAGTASAHRAWMLPSTFTFSGDSQWVTVDAAISNDLFFPNHHAIDPALVTVTGPDGSVVEIRNAAAGEIRAMFDFQMTQQGSVKVWFRVDRQGNILERRIDSSSGFSILDKATIDLLDRASPVPKPPQTLQNTDLTFTVPIAYSLN